MVLIRCVVRGLLDVWMKEDSHMLSNLFGCASIKGCIVVPFCSLVVCTEDESLPCWCASFIGIASLRVALMWLYHLLNIIVFRVSQIVKNATMLCRPVWEDSTFLLFYIELLRWKLECRLELLYLYFDESLASSGGALLVVYYFCSPCITVQILFDTYCDKKCWLPLFVSAILEETEVWSSNVLA